MIFGFLLALCYIPLWTGSVIQTGWIVLSVCLPLMLWGNLTLDVPRALLLAFLGYVGLSIAWTPIWEQGVYDLWLMAIATGCFWLGTTEFDLKPVSIGLGLGLAPSVVLAIAQLNGFTGIYQSQPAAGLFVNPDVFGEISALVAISLVASATFWPLAACLPGVVLSGSRTAGAACAVVMVAAWWRKSLIATIATVVTIAGLVYATHEGRRSWSPAFNVRSALWQDTYDGLTLWGRGAGSFLTTYPVFAKRTDTMKERAEDAHNDPLQLLYCFGLGTILLVPILAWALFYGPVGPERYLLYAFGFLALVNFPIRIPILTFLGLFALGRLASRGYVVWRDRMLCRLAVPEWAS